MSLNVGETTSPSWGHLPRELSPPFAGLECLDQLVEEVVVELDLVEEVAET